MSRTNVTMWGTESLALWATLGVSGCLWVSLDVSGCLWMSLDVSGCLWMSLGVSGVSLECLLKVPKVIKRHSETLRAAQELWLFSKTLSGDTLFCLTFLTPLTSTLTLPLTHFLTSPHIADSLDKPFMIQLWYLHTPSAYSDFTTSWLNPLSFHLSYFHTLSLVDTSPSWFHCLRWHSRLGYSIPIFPISCHFNHLILFHFIFHLFIISVNSIPST